MNAKIPVTREKVTELMQKWGSCGISDIFEEMDEASSGRYVESDHREIQVIVAQLLKEGKITPVSCQHHGPIAQPGHGQQYRWVGSDTTAA